MAFRASAWRADLSPSWEPITPLGLHYLLIHFDIPRVDPARWKLEVGGLVERPSALGLDDLLALPARTLDAVLVSQNDEHGPRDDLQIKREAALIPMGRICETEDIVGAVRYLLSPAASFISGQSIVLSGAQL